ncbi:MAG: hypothetical protein H7A37_01675 [Chlamydiales bacterium]|nr:hypothetical protein [Chlamydiia bacterium]MCP5506998.1 hypothetical protein [Chlamydiales bacterium]
MQQIQREQLRPEQIEHYRQLLPPLYRYFLEESQSSSSAEKLLFGDEHTIACVLCDPNTQRAEIQYIGFAPKHLNHNALSTCLETICKSMRSKGYTFLAIMFDTTSKVAEPLQQILQHSGWSTARPFMLRCHFDCFTFNPPWFKRPYRLPKGYTIIPWSEITEKEKSKIDYFNEQGRIHYTVYPYRSPNSIQQQNSVALRYNNDLIGWMVTHTLPALPDTVRYSSFYIEDDYRSFGHSVVLLIESIRRQQQSSLRWSYLEVNYLAADIQWIKFVERRLVPYTIDIERISSSILKL